MFSTRDLVATVLTSQHSFLFSVASEIFSGRDIPGLRNPRI